MNKHIPKKAKDIKGAVAIAELRRAHYIIAMLSLLFAAMIAQGTVYELQLSVPLAAVAIALLVLVALVSLGTAFVLRKQ